MAMRDSLTQTPSAPQEPFVDFRTHPDQYRHWTLTVEGRVATLTLDVQEAAPLVPGYELKLNSYDLGVDIELYDATQRLRFEYPEVAAVVIVSARPQVFCAGANIRMLGNAFRTPTKSISASSPTKRETVSKTPPSTPGRPTSAPSTAPRRGAAMNFALACDDIVLIDDGASAVSLPELPLLAVLPGTGGLTRLVDKRRVRHDRADFFSAPRPRVCGASELWRGTLVDALAPRSPF